MATSQMLIDQPFLEKLERLTLHWHKSFQGLVGGHNTSRFQGAGQEFLDHRHFHHGDDLRAINWRAYMRLEKLFLKMFQVEPRVPVRLMLDVSESMATGSTDKFDFARRLTAALCYVGLVRLDTICIQPFQNRMLENFSCGGGRHRFMPVVEYLSRLEHQGTTDFLEVSKEFVSAYPQRGLVVVVSDFLDEQDPEKPLQYLAEFGHELMLVQLWSEEDRTPPWDGELDLVDAESGMHLEMALDAGARQAYTEAFDAYSLRLQALAQRNGGRYVGLSTATSLEDAIFGPMLKAGSVQ